MKWQAPVWTYQDRLEARGWHSWFAWHPVRIGMTWVWLERIERRVEYIQGWRFNSYREKGSPDAD
jgi:hypothetical protein